MLRALCAAAAVGLGLAGGADAKVFHSRQEALEIAFPDADRIDKQTFVLSDEQAEEIEQRSRAPLESRLVTIFTARRGEEVLGYAHIDVHTVRTQPEAVMVVLAPGGEVRSVRVLAFHEPLDYLPADRWYEQFAGKGSGDRLHVDADVHGVVGSTLSARAAAAGVRRTLAYHAVLIATGGR